MFRASVICSAMAALILKITMFGTPAAYAQQAISGNNDQRGATIRTVGPDMNCDFTGLQAAIAAASNGDIIRVMDGGGYIGDVYDIIARQVTIQGGYSDCNLTSVPSGRTLLDGDGNGEVFDIFYTGTSMDPTLEVRLENLTIQGGGGTQGAGVLVEGNPSRLLVRLVNVEISNNSRTGTFGAGAGLRIIQRAAHTSTLSFVTVDNDSLIVNNTAGGDGGGVHCQSAFGANLLSPVLRMGTTLVANNTAGGDGGGIAISGCENVLLLNGGPEVRGQPTGGIVNNDAAGNGGGLYVENGGEVFVSAGALNDLGDGSHAALISGNHAGIGGGGVAVIDFNSTLTLEDAVVQLNTASGSGGAFRIITDSQMVMRRSNGSGACSAITSNGGNVNYPPCSMISANEANNDGGAFSLTGGSTASVSRTIIDHNVSGPGFNGSVADVGNLTIDDGPFSTLSIESSLMYANDGGFVLNAESNGTIDVAYSTFADNIGTPISASAPMDNVSEVSLISSIILRDDTLPLAATSGDGLTLASADCVIGSAPPGASGLTNTNFYSQVDPQFVDQAGADYHLSDTSPAIDYCSDRNPPMFNGLDGNTRGEPWTGPTPDPAPLSEAGGLFDLGAFEAPFTQPNADISVTIDPVNLFVNSDELSVTLQISITNNGPEAAADAITVTDQLPPELINSQWTCSGNNGGICGSPSGSGAINQMVELPNQASVSFTVTADLAMPDVDDEFSYSASAQTGMLTNDPLSGNNISVVMIETGVFASGFEDQ